MMTLLQSLGLMAPAAAASLVSERVVNTRGEQGSGLGLNLVRQRLQAHYGAAYVFEANEADGTYRVNIRVPLAAPELPA